MKLKPYLSKIEKKFAELEFIPSSLPISTNILLVIPITEKINNNLPSSS